MYSVIKNNLHDVCDLAYECWWSANVIVHNERCNLAKCVCNNTMLLKIVKAICLMMVVLLNEGHLFESWYYSSPMWHN